MSPIVVVIIIVVEAILVAAIGVYAGLSYQRRQQAAKERELGGQARTTYTALANSIGTGTGFRAVGNAVGANPVGWLIPCHNVLRRDGSLGGYHWGEDRKRAILAWESLATQREKGRSDSAVALQATQ